MALKNVEVDINGEKVNSDSELEIVRIEKPYCDVLVTDQRVNIGDGKGLKIRPVSKRMDIVILLYV